MTTNEITFITTAARVALEGHSTKGLRSAAAAAFINAQTDDEREDAVEEYGAGRIRRGLRQLAKAFRKDEEVAFVFLYLRDLINMDGTVDGEEDAADEVLETVAA